VTDTRIAAADASRYATRRARRAAERQQELAALAENPQDPSPVSGPIAVVEATVAEATVAEAPVIETAVVDLVETSPIDLGELAVEPVAVEPVAVGPVAVEDEDAPQPEPKHRVGPRKRRSPARVVLSGFALVSAAGLALAMSVPAATFGAPIAATDDAQGGAAAAASVASATGGMLSARSDEIAGQSLTVADGSLAAAGAAGTTGRADNFSAQTYADVVRAQYAGQLYHATFVPTTGAVRWPFSYPVAVSAPYGYSSTYAFGWHDGVDFIPGNGAPVSAIADGVVVWVGNDGALGYSVRIQHSIGGHTVVSIYGHMISGSSQLYPGETIKVGDQVGLTGQTGQATGPHLHLGLTVDGDYTDPYVWLTLNATNVK